jgi:hypothetical protein
MTRGPICAFIQSLLVSLFFIKKLAIREPRKLAGTGWNAFQHRDRLIRLLSQKTENWEATPEHKRRRLLKQELERDEMKTRKDKLLNMTVQGRVMKEKMETNLDGQTPLSSYLDMKSNLVSTPYSTQQQHLND